ncbi:hypothetical protein HK102_011806 [Quaeritorhiza haematococci]|nr:hypothetical protein HK102_011806 [Quaeritorhiza haematococci]
MSPQNTVARAAIVLSPDQTELQTSANGRRPTLHKDILDANNAQSMNKSRKRTASALSLEIDSELETLNAKKVKHAHTTNAKSAAAAEPYQVRDTLPAKTKASTTASSSRYLPDDNESAAHSSGSLQSVDVRPLPLRKPLPKRVGDVTASEPRKNMRKCLFVPKRKQISPLGAAAYCTSAAN